MKHSKQYDITAVKIMFFLCLAPLTACLHFCIEFLLLDCCGFPFGVFREHQNGEDLGVGVCFSVVVSATLLCYVSKWELAC